MYNDITKINQRTPQIGEESSHIQEISVEYNLSRVQIVFWCYVLYFLMIRVYKYSTQARLSRKFSFKQLFIQATECYIYI